LSYVLPRLSSAKIAQDIYGLAVSSQGFEVSGPETDGRRTGLGFDNWCSPYCH